jgi:hypothetical protein
MMCYHAVLAAHVTFENLRAPLFADGDMGMADDDEEATAGDNVENH